MTSYTEITLHCAHCGHESAGTVLLSTNSFGGSPSLDTRTCGMARSATLHDIRSCPNCQYCSTEIKRIPDGSSDVISSQTYRDTLNDRSVPEVCRQWACWAQVLEASQQYAEAGWAHLSAAWCCDDSRKSDSAIKYRREAIRLLEAAQTTDVVSDKDPATETTVLVDLYRRIGDFAHSSELAQTVLAMLEKSLSEETQMMKTINHFQLHLASIADSAEYSFAEADLYARNPSNWRPPRWWEIWR